jgi:hypothetical protein
MGKRTYRSSCVGAVDAYSCNPQSPWQRGSSANTNGLLRRYIPRAPTCRCTRMPIRTKWLVSSTQLPDAKNDSAWAALVGLDLHFHTLAKATLTGLYGR